MNEQEKDKPDQEPAPEGTEPQETVPDRIVGGAPPTRKEPQNPASLDAPRRWWQFWRK